MDNKQLIELLRQGDTATIEWVYKETCNYCKSYVLQNSGTEDNAISTFHDALIILNRKTKNESFQLTANIKSYLYGITKRLWHEELRRRGKSPPFLPLGEIDKGEIPMETTVNQSLTPYDTVFKKVFSKLDKKCREILLDRYGGLKLKDITEEKDSTVGYIKQMIFRCKNKLKKLILDELP